jgi:putative ABC transport system permease protein
MKYFPLVWAAVMRKPARAILTLLSVMLAFTLFGLTIGMNATFAKVQEEARADRIYSDPRFSGGPSSLPISIREQIAKIPGVSMVSAESFIFGYHENPKNRVFVQVQDENVAKVMTEWPIAAQQWQLIRDNRRGVIVSKMQAARWHLKVGDNFTMVAPVIKKADGTNSWTFQVVAITPDVAYMTQGYMQGNYDYLDKARVLADQGKVAEFRVQITDPSQTADIAEKIDNRFANSATPIQSITEKAALDITNSGLDIAAVDRDVALAGMFMVLFLTANGIAQAVRERLAEFATLKTIGFSDTGVILLVFAEAAIPCLLGAAFGVTLAAFISKVMPGFLPPGQGFPLPTMTPMVFIWAAVCAAAVALASAALPALRLKRMDIATALSGRA